MRFKKKNPNPLAFSPLPIEVYETAGTVEHRPLATAILSRFVAGCCSRKHTYETTTKKTIEINEGEVWCSVDTLIEDYASATGCNASRQNVRSALQWLARNGLVKDARPAIEGTGRYGKIYKLAKKCLNREGEMVDVLRAHRLFTYGAIKDFRFSGRKTETADYGYSPFEYADNRIWSKTIEKNGLDIPAYRTIGQWRYGDSGDHTAPVFIPWIVVDIDRDFYPDAHADTLAAIEDFKSAGFDERSMYVSFSGSKGFHIILSTAVIGYPIFKNSPAARGIIRGMLERWTDVKFDTSLCNPTQVCRISGSINLKSGLYKTTYTLHQFEEMGLEKLYENAKTPTAWQFPRPMIEVDAEIVEEMREVGDEVYADLLAKTRNARQIGYTLPGPVLKKILGGIGEGEYFGEHHEGRNKAAFILACYMLEDFNQLNAARTIMGLESIEEDAEISVAAWSTLQYWYENKCEKGSHPVKLRSPFQSAERIINRKQRR